MKIITFQSPPLHLSLSTYLLLFTRPPIRPFDGRFNFGMEDLSESGRRFHLIRRPMLTLHLQHSADAQRFITTFNLF